MTCKKLRLYPLLGVLLAATTLAGCAGPAARTGLAQDIAAKGRLSERLLIAPPYILTMYGRVTTGGIPANVYIEGDGLAWLGRSTISPDPTPIDPVALRLAAADTSTNVIYLARPCQYSKMNNPQETCNKADWTGGRFSPRVIAAMNEALDGIRDHTGVRGFNLIGYSGGGAIAALLTAQRDDVLSLRTVAGVLNHKRFTEAHRVSPMTESLNPHDVAQKTVAVPQLHFIGSDDKVVMPDLFQSFHDAATDHMVPPYCIRSETVQGVSHEKGWEERWADLLTHPVSCQ